jgi:hypothetical protein
VREIFFQDTVIGLEALAKLAEKLSKDTGSVRIVFKYAGDQTYMNVNSGNSMILQKQAVSWERSRCACLTRHGQQGINILASSRYSYLRKRDSST